jgi:hypothetical protein
MVLTLKVEGCEGGLAMLMANRSNWLLANLRIPLAAVILSALAAGCVGPGYYRPPIYGNAGYAYTAPVYDFRGYGRAPVVEDRRAFGGYAPGRDVWADTVRGRASYAGHPAPAHYSHGEAQVRH